MNRTYFSLFVALLIHVLFLFIYLFIQENTEAKIKKTEKKIKISLKKYIPKQKNIKKELSPIKKVPSLPIGTQFKKLNIQNKTKTIHLNKKIKKSTKKVSKIIPKKVKVKNNLLNFKKAKTIVLEKKHTESSMDWLLEDKSDSIESKKINKVHGLSTGKNIRELYGSKFSQLSSGVQKYILDNQEIMRRITQEILTRQARVSNIDTINANRVNIIEFNLHPNGDMSDFKFLQKSGYFMLDDLTQDTIEYAYSKYPRPKEKTLIRYNVYYNLLRY